MCDFYNQTAALLSCKMTSQEPFPCLVSPCKPKQPNSTDDLRSTVPQKSLFLPWARGVRYVLPSGLLLTLILLLHSNTIQEALPPGGSPASPHHPKLLHPYLQCIILQTLLGSMHACVLDQYLSTKSYTKNVLLKTTLLESNQVLSY